MINIKNKSKIRIEWNVSPYDYSVENENRIIEKISKKYSLPKENIKVSPSFIMVNEEGKEISVTNDIIANIQNTDFQLKLFKEYLKINNIIDYDFDIIKSIDAEINTNINYDVYDKYKRYKLKWIKWNNFLSYGNDNYFDFTKLKGLVLIQGMQPHQNQTGKTTFAIDLFHFLLFGNTNKVDVQSKIFNKHIPEAIEVLVEGCIEIDGIDYVIKRTLNRPSLEKRTSKSKTTQKVDYYRIVGNKTEELEDFIEAENNNGESVIDTNKIIKESIGSESDFDLTICATSLNLQNLISMKDTEKGRLLSRWIGLLPLEEKDNLAREKYNSSIKPYLISNRYNKEQLANEIEAFKIEIEHNNQEIKQLEKNLEQCKKDIEFYEKIKNDYLSSMEKIDDNIMKLDITTLTSSINDINNDIKIKKNELVELIKDINQLKDVSYSINEHEKIQERKNEYNVKLAELRTEYKNKKQIIEQLTKSEYCPTCGRKYDNIDNSLKINQLNEELDKVKKDGEEMSNEFKRLTILDDEMKIVRSDFDKKNKLIMKQSTVELKIEQSVNLLKEKNDLLENYKKNSAAIDKNNDLSIKIRNTELSLKDKRNAQLNFMRAISDKENENKTDKKYISDRDKTIQEIDKELILIKNWKIYLDMIGKNGISKMVLRKTLPIINANLTKILNGICDFTIEISINNKNEVAFYLIKDGVYSDLSSGSGFELTCGALALRSVLSNISTIPRANFFVADEVLATVAVENMENMHQLFNKILNDYDFILNVTHDESIKDWFNTILMIKKEDDISKIEAIK